MSPDVNLRSPQYFGNGVSAPPVQSATTQQVGAQPAATGTVCVGSIYGIPLFADQGGTQGAGLNQPAGAMQPASAIGYPEPFATANIASAVGGNAVAPSASGLVCIGSLSGVPVFSTPSAHTGNTPSVSASGVSMSPGGGIHSAAQGLVCIGNFAGQPLYARQQAGANIASASLPSTAGAAAAPAATGLVCIGSMSGAPLFIAQSAAPASHAAPGLTGQFAQGTFAASSGAGLTAAGMCG